MSDTVTRKVRVRVEPRYLPKRSDPTRPLYFYSYRVTIINEGRRPVKLVNRYWHITDANGNVEEIRGPGVVGRQPRLKNKQSFQYTSFCPLQTGFGVMQGWFEMVYDNGQRFEARISPFKLAVPFSVN